MHWTASAPVSWPADAVWQSAWRRAVDAAAAATTVHPDGTVAIEGAGPGEPPVTLTEGQHLQPGAAYRIAPELTTGLLRGWVGAERAAGVEWAPYGEAGRAHLEVQGLERLRAIRGESTLRHVAASVRVDLDDPAHLLDASLTLDWASVTLNVQVRSGLLTAELGISGRGLWRPTLAPMIHAASASIEQELQTSVDDAARAVTELPTTGTLVLPSRSEPLADQQQRHLRELRVGVAELERRQHLVLDVVEALPWWRRSPGRWRSEAAALPPGTWPGTEALPYGGWPERELAVTDLVARVRRGRRAERLDAVVAAYGEELAAARVEQDRQIEEMVRSSRASAAPWLTDEATDLSWLASPWKVLKEGSRIS